MRYRLHSITDYIKGAGLFMSASVLMLIMNLLANPVIALNMSPYDYAITGYYTSFNGLISPLILFYLIGYYVKEYFKVSPNQREILYADGRSTPAPSRRRLSGGGAWRPSRASPAGRSCTPSSRPLLTRGPCSAASVRRV